MKTIKIALLILSILVSTFCLAEKVELKVKEDVLPEELNKSGSISFVLPQFYIFNTEAEAIFYQQSLPDNFIKLLKKAIQANKPINRKKNLDSILSETSTLEDKDYPLPNLENYDFVFVEYWADWCSPCFAQMKQVESFIKSHPDTEILWLKIERDPTKI